MAWHTASWSCCASTETLLVGMKEELVPALACCLQCRHLSNIKPGELKLLGGHWFFSSDSGHGFQLLLAVQLIIYHSRFQRKGQRESKRERTSLLPIFADPAQFSIPPGSEPSVSHCCELGAFHSRKPNLDLWEMNGADNTTWSPAWLGFWVSFCYSSCTAAHLAEIVDIHPSPQCCS